jgi:alpha-D-ribose 1-methylphosphonate 5-triphosphate synthase subunit PhnH
MTGATPETVSHGFTQETLTDKEGLKIMLLVVAEEVDGHSPMRATMSTVESVARFTPSLRATLIDRDTATFLNYTLRITRTEDKRRFQASLTPTSRCGKAWFGTSEKTVFVGSAIGCVK